MDAARLARQFGLGGSAALSDGPVARGRQRVVWRLEATDGRWAVKVPFGDSGEEDERRREHRADLDQWDHDTDRRDWLEAHGWLLVSVFSRGIFRDPAKTVGRVEAALRSRCAVLPRRLPGEWRAYFPGY